MIRKNQRKFIVLVVLVLAFSVVLFPGLFGRGEPEVDPMAVDAHLQQIEADKAAEQRQAVTEARAREEQREEALETKVDQRGS